MAKVTSNVRVRTSEQKAAFTARMAAAKAAKKTPAAEPKKAEAKTKVSVVETGRVRTIAEPAHIKAVKAAPKKFAAKKDTAPHIPHVDPPKVVSPTNKTVVNDGAPVQHTMARSYLRSGKPGEGKLRNGTLQCTVSFTPPQMAMVKEAAIFRGVSLAEMIRSCVVGHLSPDQQ